MELEKNIIPIREENLFEIIANSATNYLSVADTNYRYLAVNKAYSTGFNLPAEEIVGKTSEELIGTHEFHTIIKPHFDKAIAEDQPVEFEDWFQLPHGRRYFAVSYTPVNTDGNRKVVVISVHDNTRHKLQEETLERMVAELEKANEYKNKLFSIVSHDIKSPMASIYSFLEMFVDGNEIDESAKDLLPQLFNRVKHTNAMINSLIEWATGQISGDAAHQERFCVKKIVDEVVALYEEEIKAKNILLDNRLMDKSYVIADKNSVRLIFRNLLSNSIKFSYPEGTITIREQKPSKNGFSQFIVADQGKGMSKEKTSQLFTNIVSSEQGTQGESGTGLGMMLVGDSISLHGGKIWAESAINEGSKFYFTLPKG